MYDALQCDLQLALDFEHIDVNNEDVKTDNHCVQTDTAKKCLDSCISNSGTEPDWKKARRR
jgi:hypothetical protein